MGLLWAKLLTCWEFLQNNCTFKIILYGSQNTPPKPSVRTAMVYKHYRGVPREMVRTQSPHWRHLRNHPRDKGQLRHSWNTLNSAFNIPDQFSVPLHGSWVGKTAIGNADGACPWLQSKAGPLLTKIEGSGIFRSFCSLVVSPPPLPPPRIAWVEDTQILQPKPLHLGKLY